MLNLETLKENNRLIQSLRLNYGVEKEDDTKDFLIHNLSVADAFDRFLTWHGIIGYSHRLMTVITSLRLAEINNRIDPDKLGEVDGCGIIESIRKITDIPDFASAEFDEFAFDKYIKSLSLNKAFKSYLTWHGIIGFDSLILEAVETLEKSNY